MLIKNIQANRDSFNAAYFADQFNVILADVTDKSTDKDSRNGLGKLCSLKLSTSA